MLHEIAASLKKLLQYTAIFLKVLWIFFPGILFVLLGAEVFLNLSQGRDVIVAATESPFRGLFIILGLIFWVYVTWYSGRLIAYNHDKIFALVPKLLFHIPRLLGFGCFLVIILAMANLPIVNTPTWLMWVIFLADLALYFLFHFLFEKIREGHNKPELVKYRRIIRIAAVATALAIGLINQPAFYLIGLLIIQLGFLFLVIIRRKIRSTEVVEKAVAAPQQQPKPKGRLERFLGWVLIDKHSVKERAWLQYEIELEKGLFLWFNIFAMTALIVYLLTIFNLSFSIFISSFPFVLLAFGVLLGFGNFITLLSTKLKINFHFLFIVAIFLLGVLFEPHGIRIFKNENVNQKIFDNRQNLTEYFHHWISQRKTELTDSTLVHFPVFFVLADGGASRSGFWTASVLSRLEDQTNGDFSRHLFCLSGASGGSVGNATFFASLIQKQQIRNNKQDHLVACQKYLDTDFLTFTLARMLGPDLFKPIFPFPSIYDRAAALEKAIEQGAKDTLISKVMQSRFSSFITRKRDSSYTLPVLCINTTRMQDGRPAVVSNIRIDSLFFGRRIDILELLDPGEDVNMSTMTILGARFPYVSPAGRISNSYFVDGGYFDNSGAGVTHEMILELQRMITDSLQTDSSHYLKKLRFYVLHTTNSPLGEGKISKVHPLINDLAAPIKALVGSYNTQTSVNNLRLFKYLMEINNGDTNYIPFNLYRKDESEIYSMNWVISDTVRSLMNQRLLSYKKIDDFIRVMKRSNNHVFINLYTDEE